VTQIRAWAIMNNMMDVAKKGLKEQLQQYLWGY